MTQSIENKVLEHLINKQKAKIYFQNDFASLGGSDSIRKSLSNLVKREVIIRLTQGIYLYPKIDKELGVLYPSVDDVCRTIAKETKQELNLLGFAYTV